ncbi:MAG: LacI family DNA-binding transcriptional regulator [bacterium]
MKTVNQGGVKKSTRIKSTIRDVAKEAGVSIATVSRIVNNIPGHYNEKTKKRVVQTIENLNYRPNAVARSLRGRKTRTIGFVVPGLQPFFAEVLEGVQSVARKKGYSTVLCNTDYRPKQEEAYVASLLERRVDGVIFTSGVMKDEHILRLKEEGIPIVLIEKFMEGSDLPAIVIDNLSAAKKAVKHLLSLGYREVGYISAPLELVPLRERFEGYKQALLESRVLYDSSVVYIEKTIKKEDLRSGYKIMKRILHQGNFPRAFFIVSDTLAIGAIKAIKDCGMKVPDNIAIVGFDDIDIASFSDPPLTTMVQPKYQMGVKGMEMLIKAMTGVKLRKKEIKLDIEIAVRGSCGGLRKM